MHEKRFLIIGEVFVDYHLDIIREGYCTSRLGGIFHAARSCNALNLDYSLAYFAPSYLQSDIEKFGIDKLSAEKIYCLGIVDKAPNVMLISQSDESSNQLYENILCKQAKYTRQLPLNHVLDDFKPTDIIIFPGRYCNKKILDELSEFDGKIHIDLNYDSEDINCLEEVNVETVFLSTSTTSFKSFFKECCYDNLLVYFRNKKVNRLLIKENRGGSWLYDFNKNISYEAPAYIGDTIHSVGVGDVYDVAFITEIAGDNIRDNMLNAAWVSSQYAKTFLQNIFKDDIEILVQNFHDFIEMEGVRVPWNKRTEYPIYMAAPDFDYVDTTKLDELVGALLYHNFKPRMPIRENGQTTVDMDINEERIIFSRDIMLLSECKIMIAVLLYNDQGTLVEIGKYFAEGKSIILYDPYQKLDNMFLKYSCTHYCTTKSQVIDKVFIEVSRMVKDGK